MARIRSIKPEFWTDEKIVDLTPVAKLLFIGIWNFADDEGNITNSIRQLQFKIFPGNDYDIKSALEELVAEGLVVEMDSDQGPVLTVPRFRDHQSPKNPTSTKFTGLKPHVRPSATPEIPQDFPSDTEVLTTERRGEEGSRSSISSPPPASVITSKFGEAYSHWPKKVKREDALARFKTAVKARGLDALVADVIRFGDAYKRYVEKQFTPALGVWLRGERWTDELPGPVEPPGRPEKLRLGGPGGMSAEEYHRLQDERAEAMLRASGS